ncbi:hypothetical protein H8S33_10495 [Ornithinibacillus sp. BX22]|uniref:Uncharacterized protein n=1 Tax=Ornithinibacillus hominis TaxID=2763055 RepID=A0A923L6B0_9BACI|nr:hypothetical protein [Ornithinibacillus hominis]MBC5637232.1 hypothetical protein [Ornithinibacillus hominis]
MLLPIQDFFYNGTSTIICQINHPNADLTTYKKRKKESHCSYTTNDQPN